MVPAYLRAYSPATVHSVVARHKLLDAYYNDAIPLDLLKIEKDRIGREIHRTQQRLDNLAPARDGHVHQ